MRLSGAESSAIQSVIRSDLGDGAKVWLFGSRVDDTAKGGDIDLYVETSCRTNMETRTRLKERLIDATERGVDLVVNDFTRELPIFEIARKTGIRLR